jgi:hypothetical protein
MCLPRHRIVRSRVIRATLPVCVITTTMISLLSNVQAQSGAIPSQPPQISDQQRLPIPVMTSAARPRQTVNNTCLSCFTLMLVVV